MSVNDIPRNSFNGMPTTDILPTAPPEYSGPGTSGTRYPCTVGLGIATEEDFQDLNPPPAYNDLFARRHSPAPWDSKSNPYNKDDRNAWEIVHEWFELSILQQIIWLGALAFSISYIYYGALHENVKIINRNLYGMQIRKTRDPRDMRREIRHFGGDLHFSKFNRHTYGLEYSGDCYWKKIDKEGVAIEEDDLTYLMEAEGGVSCALVLYVFLWRLWAFCTLRRSDRISVADMEGQKKCGGMFFFCSIGIFWANFGMCVAGATKIVNLYDNKDTSDEKNYTVQCDPDFYWFYYNAEIGHLAVVVPYVTYVLISFIFVIPVQNKGVTTGDACSSLAPDPTSGISRKKWSLRRKWRQWVRLLDADQDGFISPGDMEKANAKLEQIRRLVGARTSPMSSEDQTKWWNNHIFKCGPGKSMSLEDYTLYLEGLGMSMDKPHENANKLRPIITGFFNFFSTHEYRKKNHIINEHEFSQFWSILAGIEEDHCRKIFRKHFPAPVTMASFLEDFTALISNVNFWEENSNRVFNLLKFRRSGCCCEVHI